MTREKKTAAAIVTVTGVFQGSNRGFGFVVPENGAGRADDYFIPPRSTGGAWHGDRVEATPDPAVPGEEGRRTATVSKILVRANVTVTGSVRHYEKGLWLWPDSDKIPGPIQIAGKNSGLLPGEKVAIEVQSYGGHGRPPVGVLRETFGRAGSREASTAAILYRNEIDTAFPLAVLAEAEAKPQTVTEGDLAGRTDLREKTVITIDGASSKDLDDAVSLEKDGDGNWLLGVHIADVSHYVAERSPLDLEAWERGNSVYYADRVIPMLPVALSNGICSLNPAVERLALSCHMTFNARGGLLGHKITKSVIRSTERMTYEECNLLLEPAAARRAQPPAVQAAAKALAVRYAAILPMLKDMAKLAKALEKLRGCRGSLDLDTSESYIICDGAGAPVDIRARRQGQSEALIESFMLAANECVARHLFDGEKPGVYRVHEKPSADKTEALKAMLAPFGYDVGAADNFALQKILAAAKEKPEAPIINTMVLRSLMKARYDIKNLGHFGLAAPYYCHFTSPIRRYSDLMVHRILTKMLADEASGAPLGKAMPWEKAMTSAAEKAAAQASEREIAAQTAEREITKLYMAEFMQAHLGEELPATVSGVTRNGLFLMLPSGVEGYLPAEALPGDRYRYDEARMTLRGEVHGGVYSFGMALQAVCVAADSGSGQIEFRLPGLTDVAVTPRAPKENGPERFARHADDHRGLRAKGGKRPFKAPGRGKGRKKR